MMINWSRYFILFLLAFPPVSAKVVKKKFRYSSYSQASVANSRIVFEVKSIKAGVFDTKFLGVVREFALEYESVSPVLVKDIRINIPVKALDTDLKVRNKKLREHSFSAHRWPMIRLEINQSFDLLKKQKVQGLLYVKNKAHKISILLHSIKGKDGVTTVKGRSQVSLKRLGLADPSNVLAKVQDDILILFNIRHIQ